MEIFNFQISETDVFLYMGEISRQGYSELSQLIADMDSEERKSKVLLCLATFGGDPDAGYRIGRCLQHYYEKQVSVYAPSLCKSSGTLTAIAANNLIIGNEGELGPLDIQLRKADEMGEQSSGLDIFKAVNFLEDRVMDQFSNYLTAIRFGSGISTKLSADIAAKLVNSVIEPISNQIDPIKIGEHQRAIGIAQFYGERLNEMTNSLQKGALTQLIGGYPSHGFVIDRKEAGKLFNNVFKPCDKLQQILKTFTPYCFDFKILAASPPLVLPLVSGEKQEETITSDKQSLVQGKPLQEESNNEQIKDGSPHKKTYSKPRSSVDSSGPTGITGAESGTKRSGAKGA